MGCFAKGIYFSGLQLHDDILEIRVSRWAHIAATYELLYTVEESFFV
jgi:hypothetical protein